MPVSGILRDLYGLKRPSYPRQEEVTQLYDNQLKQWHDDLGDFLEITKTELMMPIFRRQHTVLQLAYSHAIILLHRQALLTKPSTSNINHENASRMSLQYSTGRCLDAATAIVTKLRELILKQEMYSAYWARKVSLCTARKALTYVQFTHYYVFSALVALYVYAVQSRSKASHIWKRHLDLAQQGLSDLAACSTDMTYAQRYVVVLTELQNEAMKPIEEGNRSAVPANEALPSCERLCPAPGDISGTELGSHAILSVSEDGAVSSQEIAIDTDLDNYVPRDSIRRGQHDVYDSTDDPWALQTLENREAFRSLGIEGLADLSFMFSTENTDTLQIDEGIF
ncbi:fungal specific transcription factor domain-containing protein [Aspergillus melleus]|uniref:fungal specific transcription factor domain-containing protein n=1 Tax=Aspergillus melleus TaxID=138277 RepID=UPI001E8EC2B8|nr:uncharacterized protein LDX57_002862 [Aspergillus melleus]KAH8425113.1 hypothetical protein LDX57_002862 [Aspergillus melleus]